MQEFIQMAVSQLGISEDAAKTATGGVLDFLKGKAGDGLVTTILGQVPELKKLLG